MQAAFKKRKPKVANRVMMASAFPGRMSLREFYRPMNEPIQKARFCRSTLRKALIFLVIF